jgi:hypothetical protein
MNSKKKIIAFAKDKQAETGVGAGPSARMTSQTTFGSFISLG